MLALLQEHLVVLFLFLLVFAAFLEEFGLLLLECVLFELLNHLEPVSDLLLVLLLQVDDPMDVDGFFLELTMLTVDRGVDSSRVSFFTLRAVAERPQVLDRDELVERFVVHEEDIFIGQTIAVFGHLLIAEPCLDCSTSDDVFAVQVVIVLE